MLLTTILIALLFGSSIAFHELGHYLAARKGGLSVTKFAIGFGPIIWSRLLKNGTNLELRAIPLGGFVQIPDLENTNRGRQHLISKLTRFNVFIGGVTFNIIYAFVLGLILWGIGLPASRSYDSTRLGYIAKEVEPGISSPAISAGLQAGDRIISIDGNPVNSWSDIVEAVVLGKEGEKSIPRTTLLIERAGQKLTLSMTPYVNREGLRKLGILPFGPAVIGSTIADSPAAKVGLPQNARVLKINDQFVYSPYALFPIEGQNQPVTLEYITTDVVDQRTTDQVEALYNTQPIKRIVLQPAMPVNKKEPSLGILWSGDFDIYISHVDPFTYIYKAFRTTFRTLASLFSSDSSIGVKHMSGPVGITSAYYTLGDADWRFMLWFTLVINVSLAISNLLPLPVLDGGHLFFLGIEALRNRPPSAWMYTLIEKAQTMCATMLIIFALYVTYHDVTRIAHSPEEQPYEQPRFK